MVSFKKILTHLLLLFNTLFAFSAHPKVVSKSDFATLKKSSQSCKKELEDKIKDILSIQTFNLSKRAFTNDSYLYLTNQKLKPFSHQDRLQGYIGANQIFLLHFKKGKLFLSLVDNNNRVLKSKEILFCKTKQKDSR